MVTVIKYKYKVTIAKYLIHFVTKNTQILQIGMLK